MQVRWQSAPSMKDSQCKGMELECQVQGTANRSIKLDPKRIVKSWKDRKGSGYEKLQMPIKGPYLWSWSNKNPLKVTEQRGDMIRSTF